MNYVACWDLWAKAVTYEKNVITIEYSVFPSLPFGNRSKFLRLVLQYHIFHSFDNFVISNLKLHWYGLIHLVHNSIHGLVAEWCIRRKPVSFHNVVLFLNAWNTWRPAVFVTLMLCSCWWYAIVRVWTNSEVHGNSYSSLLYSHIAQIM